MGSTFVIKVKYGDTLRRFNACVNENEQLDLGMSGLREKIINLFNFPSDSEFNLTYIDEDGDVVSLVDDDDLRDVMRQPLKFLRIDVQLNSETSANSSARSSRSSTPIRASMVESPLPSINTLITETLKSMPEPLREALSKRSHDLASKAASTSSVLADLVECFSKMAQSYLNPDTQPQFDLNSRAQHGPSQSPMASSVPIEPTAASDNGLVEILPKTSSLDLSSENIPENVTRCMDSSIAHAPASVDLNLDPPIDLNLPDGAAADLGPPASDVSPTNDRKTAKESSKYHRGKSVIVDASSSFADPVKSSYPHRRHTTGCNGNASQECPFSGIPVANDPLVLQYMCPRVSPFKRCHPRDAMGGMFHKGVRCDGCGVHPIIGPRYKSKVKEDYDLCNVCFLVMDNETDYYRIDRPLQLRRPQGFLKVLHHSKTFSGPYIGDFGAWPNKPKLDSRFLQDVNVLDGTVMSPGTSFTKIWQMRNNGSLVWPYGTQLLWIGGDRFSGAVRVELEIPVCGVAPDGELNVAVDFTAPQLPGRYISYWRMASPTGVKFGQRVWVLIQVETTLCDLTSDIPADVVSGVSGLNLNVSPIDINVQSTQDGYSLECNRRSNRSTQPLEPTAHDQPKDEELNFLKKDGLPDAFPFAPQQAPSSSSASFPMPDAYPSAPQQAPSSPSVSYPLADAKPSAPHQAPSSSSSAPDLISDLKEKAPSAILNASSSVTVSSEEINEDDDVEKTLLKELEEMGFKQVDLNKDILRTNGYNLEQSIDALCDVSEWDPILEELQEMGFYDKEVNKMLLKKNNGSIKAVVMDLLSGEKPYN